MLSLVPWIHGQLQELGFVRREPGEIDTGFIAFICGACVSCSSILINFSPRSLLTTSCSGYTKVARLALLHERIEANI